MCHISIELCAIMGIGYDTFFMCVNGLDRFVQKQFLATIVWTFNGILILNKYILLLINK